MKLVALDIPEDPTALAAWLEQRLIGLDLGTLVAELDAILEASPKDAPCHRLAAEIQWRLGHIDEAVRHLEAAVALDPSDRESQGLLALLRAADRTLSTLPSPRARRSCWRRVAKEAGRKGRLFFLSIPCGSSLSSRRAR